MESNLAKSANIPFAGPRVRTIYVTHLRGLRPIKLKVIPEARGFQDS